jgi:ABC-type glycerol-3-phosphate transport system substrate-binding protein
MRSPKLGIALTAVALSLAAGSAAALSAAPARAAAGDASVTIVHGIPNTPVDVYANGKEILPDFTFKTVTSPLSLPAGSYTIDVREAGSSASSTPILTATEQVPAGADLTIVADLTAAGKPALTPFVNDSSAVGDGKGRLVVRHTAAAPAVDVYAGSAKVIGGLTNGQRQGHPGRADRGRARPG